MESNMALLDRLRNRTPENKDDQQTIRTTGAIWEYLKESRRKKEYEWFINDQFYNNNQYLQYNTAAKKIQAIPSEKILDKVTINKCYQQVRGIVNFLNAEHPSVGVRPGDDTDDGYLRAKKEKHLADYWYRHLQMNREGKKVSLDAAKYGLGWWKVLYDTDALSPTKPFVMADGSMRNDTYGEVMVKRCDTFEVYPDPMAEDKESMRYLIHAPVRTVGELQNNKLYSNREKVVADSRLAASNLRQTELRQSLSSSGVVDKLQPEGLDTCVTLEVFRKYFDKYSNKWSIRVTTQTLGGVLLRDEEFGVDEIPFEYFQTDIAGKVLDSKGVIHNIREPNRALNQMVSQVQESARIMGKLNWLIPKGSNVNVITDEAGQFIEYDVTPGGAPHQAVPGSLPTYIMQQIGQLDRFIDDIGGMHASFNGRAPFAQASGDLVDTLSEGDQNNLTMMRDNYDDAWVRLFKMMFKTAKQNYKGTKNFPTDMQDDFGQTRWLDLKPSEINTNDDLAVSTGTGMPYSISQKQQMYMNLWKEKAITDPTMLFKLLEMPDIDAALGNDDMDVERQLGEIKNCVKVGKIEDPVISENHSVHISVLDKFIKTEAYYDKLNDIQRGVLQDHRQKHIEYVIQLAQISAAQQFEPIKRSMTSMLRMNKMSDTTAIERTQMLQKFGVNSDAAQIQLRGGLYIQDPQQAEMQAQNEDIEMMDMRAVQVSFGDNHQVHIETHAPVYDAILENLRMQSRGTLPPGIQPVSETVGKLFERHIKDHIDAMSATQVAPGLVPNDQVNMPNRPNLKDNAQPGEMPKQSPPPISQHANSPGVKPNPLMPKAAEPLSETVAKKSSSGKLSKVKKKGITSGKK